MKLTISKQNFFAGIYAAIASIFIIYIIGFFFFSLMISYEGSDYSSNMESIVAVSKGYFGGNTPTNPLMYLLLDAHYYFWLLQISNLFEDGTFALQSLTIIATLAIVFPVVLAAGKRNNKVLMYPLLFVIFLHPRFIDLVAGNIRSGCALAILISALNMKDSKLKYLLIFISPTFHLGTLPLIFLYFIHKYWKVVIPRFLSGSEVKTVFIFFMAGALCLGAKIIFPERGGGEWEGRFAYTVAIILLSAVVFFLGKHFVNNKFGFLSLGLISIVLWGAILDYSTMRYFSFFFPFFATAVLHFHRQYQPLLLLLFVITAFTLISHSTYLLV